MGGLSRAGFPWVGMDRWAGSSGEGRPKSLPCSADRGGPPPGRVDAQADLSGASGDARRDVQDAVAGGGDLAHEICCGQDISSQAAWRPTGAGWLASPVALGRRMRAVRSQNPSSVDSNPTEGTSPGGTAPWGTAGSMPKSSSARQRKNISALGRSGRLLTVPWRHGRCRARTGPARRRRRWW